VRPSSKGASGWSITVLCHGKRQTITAGSRPEAERLARMAKAMGVESRITRNGIDRKARRGIVCRSYLCGGLTARE